MMKNPSSSGWSMPRSQYYVMEYCSMAWITNLQVRSIAIQKILKQDKNGSTCNNIPLLMLCRW